MAGSRRLIVGLGNPGGEYAKTRHNVGFFVVDALRKQLELKFKTKGEARLAWGKWRGFPIGLMKPQTSMNRSGLAVEKAVRDYGLSAGDLLVVVDDVNLPVGKIRIRPGGGAGGHNGITDIIDWLDDDSFPRLRIGIGNDYERGRQADYVLSPFTDVETPHIDHAVDRAAQAALAWVADGLQTAMNRFSS